jgi:hypothetical protein
VTVRISWSALKVQEECSEKGFHRRAGAFAKQNDQRVYFPGTVLDRVVRDWLNNGHEPDTMPDMVAPIIDREWRVIQDEGGTLAWKNAADKKEVQASVIEAVKKIQPALQRFVLPFDYQADFKFRVPVKVPHPAGGQEEILLIGAMDITVRDDKGRWIVWDVKHTRDSSYWRKTVGQLTFYDFANLLMTGQPTLRAGLLQPLCPEQIKLFTISDEDRAQMQMRIASMARSIWLKERIPRKDTTYCGWCEARAACSKFTPILQGNGRRTMDLF